MKTLKGRAEDVLKGLHTDIPENRELYLVEAVELLQEVVDAPEPEPVARVTGYYAGYLTIATVDGRVLPAGTALYLAPPAPTPAEAPADVARDAARYRWLRNSNWYVGPESFYHAEGGDIVGYQNENYSAENLDAVVDAVRGEKGQS